MTPQEIQSLFVDVKKKCARGGFEIIRRNSSGKAIWNHHMKAAFSYAGLLPKRQKGTIIFPSKVAGGWVTIYLKARQDERSEREVVCWDKYTQPQVGGNFYINSKVSKIANVMNSCSYFGNSH